jgi:hypothetical protein
MPTRYEARNQKGLFFWAERVPGKVPCFNVVSQADGFPATEAHDDWFANLADADAMARELAETNPGIGNQP